MAGDDEVVEKDDGQELGLEYLQELNQKKLGLLSQFDPNIVPISTLTAKLEVVWNLVTAIAGHPEKHEQAYQEKLAGHLNSLAAAIKQQLVQADAQAGAELLAKSPQADGQATESGLVVP